MADTVDFVIVEVGYHEAHFILFERGLAFEGDLSGRPTEIDRQGGFWGVGAQLLEHIVDREP